MELRKILQKALDDFGISISNILCFVTDNATNMVKMVRDMGDELLRLQAQELMTVWFLSKSMQPVTAWTERMT